MVIKGEIFIPGIYEIFLFFFFAFILNFNVACPVASNQAITGFLMGFYLPKPK